MPVRAGEGRETVVALFPQHASKCREDVMETKDLKKFLAGFGIAGLLAGAGLGAPTANAAGNSG